MEAQTNYQLKFELSFCSLIIFRKQILLFISSETSTRINIVIAGFKLLIRYVIN